MQPGTQSRGGCAARQSGHFVSVIIPTVDRSTLSETTGALERQSRPPDEIIVVQDRERRGPSWARNEGIRKARGNLIAFIDDDCVPGERWLEKFVDAIDEHGAAMVSSHYLEADPFLAEIRRRRRFPDTTVVDPDRFIGIAGNVIYRRDCLLRLRDREGHVFNPVFGCYASEDIELVWRLRRDGERMVFIVNEVEHRKTMNGWNYMRHQVRRGIGLAILDRLRRRSGETATPDRSILWDEQKNAPPGMRWIKAMWFKIVGPFDRSSFSSTGRFFMFWLGEKAQALGYLIGRFRKV